jgi:hypothetical protein
VQQSALISLQQGAGALDFAIALLPELGVEP